MAQLAKVIRTTDGYNFFVDVEDFARLSKFKWHSYFDGFHRYASRYVGKKAGKDVYKSLHREVLNVNSKYEVDHISGDTSDNRKENLRLCTHQENMRNQGPRKGTSKYKGVSWNSAKQKWIAQIQSFGKKIYLGQFESERAAAKAYDVAAAKFYGEFAYVNAV